MTSKFLKGKTLSEPKNFSDLIKNLDTFQAKAINSFIRNLESKEKVAKIIEAESSSLKRKTVIATARRRIDILSKPRYKAGRKKGSTIKEMKEFQPVQSFANVKWSGNIEFQSHWFQNKSDYAKG